MRSAIDFFPPTEASNPPLGQDVRMDVLVGLFDITVHAISPETASFSLTFETDMYWRQADCAASTVLSHACANRAGTWYFLFAPEEDPSAAKVQTTYTALAENGGVGTLPESFGVGCTSGDFLRLSTKIHHRYDMTHYPFEHHTIEILLRAQLPLRSVSLILLDENPTASDNPVPSGWVLGSPFKCSNGSTSRSDLGRGSVEFEWAFISCTGRVHKVRSHLVARWLSRSARRGVACAGGQRLVSQRPLPLLHHRSHQLLHVPRLGETTSQFHMI